MNSPRNPLPGGLSSALSEAQSIIAAAEQKKEGILRAAAEVTEQARRDGFQQGLIEGKEEANTTAIRLLNDLGALQEEIARESARLAIQICRTILGEQLSLDQSRVVELARQALHHSISGTWVILLVHPEDVERLERERELLHRTARGADVRIEADPSLSKGGCIVRTDFGEVDASIEAILQNLSEKLGV